MTQSSARGRTRTVEVTVHKTCVKITVAVTVVRCPRYRNGATRTLRTSFLFPTRIEKNVSVPTLTVPHLSMNLNGIPFGVDNQEEYYQYGHILTQPIFLHSKNFVAEISTNICFLDILT